MAYVSVSDWRPEQVIEWLKGLDSCLLPYLHSFSKNEVNGQQLLNICPGDLQALGVEKIGHQEIILEGVQHLQNFHYELDRENLQSLALRVACAAHSVHAEVEAAVKNQTGLLPVPTHILCDVSNINRHVISLVSWLGRTPFSGQSEYDLLKPELLSLCLNLSLNAHRDKFADSPMTIILECSAKLGKLADSIIQDSTDPMVLQPLSLDLATLKKRVGEDLGFFLVPSFHGEHQVGDMKLSSPAHQSGKIQVGDEVVQVNYQTVVGWARKKVIALIEESPNDLLLTLKRRPRHVNMYGQIYMKPYRLPSRKRTAPYSRWNENLPSPRPDFLTIPHFELPSRVTTETKQAALEDSVTSSSSDEEFPPPHSSSPTSMRLYLPKPRAPIQRRFTLSGPPRPSAQTEQFWRELQLERSWRSNQNNSQTGGQKDGEVTGLPMREKSVSEGAAVAADKSAVSDVRTIIEQNKVKRDAFFSDMGCPPKPAPPRGRLDKSRSTPAYDLGEPESRESRPSSRERSPKELERKSCSQVPSSPNELTRKSGQARKSCSQVPGSPRRSEQRLGSCDRLAKVGEPPSPSPRSRTVWDSPGSVSSLSKPWGYDQSRTGTESVWSGTLSNAESSICLEKSPEQEHGQMVNTINQTLHRDRDDDVFFSDVPPAPREIRPVPAQRKYTLPPAPAPLPPKPKPRPLPPEPPPRPDLAPPPSPGPSTPTFSVSTERERTTRNTLDHLKAMWTLGRSNSPRSARKHNTILARRRHVAVKDLLPGDVSGSLWYRRRRGQTGWTQGFFILQGPAFYGFKHRERTRADLFIFLPGFTCSLAEEVKSKSYAFKIYHTGTVFYFAADSEEELQQWMDGASLATASSEESRSGDSPGWSETDSGSSDTEPPPDSCFPSRSKLLGAPARSHQNLTSESNKCDSPRKFSSLKKLSGSGKPSGDNMEAASLDRKYLKFLPQKTTPVPVRTSQFRSYRRTQPPPAPPPTSLNLEPPRLSRRALHSSNPSLINPEMADYRMTQERLRQFRNLRNQGRPVDLTGFMTLEQFMLSRQEEERNLRVTRQSRTRVYPTSCRDSGPEVRTRSDDSTSDKPKVMPRNIVPAVKLTSPPPSTTASMSSVLDEASGSGEHRRGLPPKPPQTTALPEYPGIEYPPAFEPETYTLQYMLKNRRKRDAANK